MRALLGLLMVLMVSGDNRVTVKFSVGHSALLPCTCMGRNLERDIKWQKTSPGAVVFYSNKTRQYYGPNYTSRVRINLTNESNNCSLLLEKVTPDDHGEYKCIFFQDQKYTSKSVNLHVCGMGKISQQNFSLANGVTKFRCELLDCSGNEEIQWTLNGRPIENSSMNISTKRSLDDSTGLYNFSTSLSTKLNSTLKLECRKKLLHGDTPKPDTQRSTDTPEPQTDYNRIPVKVTPLALVLGLSLILCFILKYRRLAAEGNAENRQLEHGYVKCNGSQNENNIV